MLTDRPGHLDNMVGLPGDVAIRYSRTQVGLPDADDIPIVEFSLTDFRDEVAPLPLRHQRCGILHRDVPAEHVVDSRLHRRS